MFLTQSGGLIKNFFYSVSFGILNAGLFLSLGILFLPFNWLIKFSGSSLNILGSEVSRFIWIFLPIILILFLNKKKKGPGRPSLY